MMSFKLSLAKNDSYIIKQFKNDINSNHPIHLYVSKRKNQQATTEIILNNHKFYNDLTKVGVYPRKSLTLKFPTKEQVSPNLIHHFIRGYFDGDGCITFQNVKELKYPNIHICGTCEFLESLRICLIEHGIDIKIPLDKRHLNRKEINMYDFRISHHSLIISFYSFIYKDATRFLIRKKKRFDDWMNLKKIIV